MTIVQQEDRRGHFVWAGRERGKGGGGGEGEEGERELELELENINTQGIKR